MKSEVYESSWIINELVNLNTAGGEKKADQKSGFAKNLCWFVLCYCNEILEAINL
jgi:hypothetical protein